MFYKNRYDERLYEKDLQRLVARLRKLSDSTLHSFFSEVGGNEKGEKAIKAYADRIRSSEKEAGRVVVELFGDTEISRIHSALQMCEEEQESRSGNVRNEFGETLSSNELRDIARRVRGLPDLEIDRLWFKIGFIYSDRGENRAIGPDRVANIKGSENGALTEVVRLFTETKLDTIKRNLDSIETDLRSK